jgi:hypothetical protein
MINDQGPQQNTQHYGLENPLRDFYTNFQKAFIQLVPKQESLKEDEVPS